MKGDPAIDVLLELDGAAWKRIDGYSVKIHARRVVPSPAVPHGIRYSLTLHDPHGNRILGYDNAHAVKPSNKFKYAGRVLPYDHKHRYASDRGVPYEFKDAQTLIDNFYADVERVVQEGRK